MPVPLWHVWFLFSCTRNEDIKDVVHLTQDFEHVNVKSFNLKGRFINLVLYD